MRTIETNLTKHTVVKKARCVRGGKDRECVREGKESKTLGKILRDTLEDTVKSSMLLGNIDVLVVGASILIHNILT